MKSFINQMSSGIAKRLSGSKDPSDGSKRSKHSSKIGVDPLSSSEYVSDPLFWGPYLSERQWGTVREDYSPDGSCWKHIDYMLACKQAYRWGEDGLLGVCDKFGLLCGSLALWNHKDPILKERLFGLTGDEGNHGEDVKELYYYLDNTPNHTYMRALYKYPIEEFPYEQLQNHGRTAAEGEFEIMDTGVFDECEFWDIQVEYAKPATHSLACKITVTNNSENPATLDIIPQFFFRNTWSWPEITAPVTPPVFQASGKDTVDAVYEMGIFRVNFQKGPNVTFNSLLFTNNESVFTENEQTSSGDAVSQNLPGRKDAFHRFIVDGDKTVVCQDQSGTKVCAWMTATVQGHGSTSVYWQIFPADFVVENTAERIELMLKREKAKAFDFYKTVIPPCATEEEANMCRQAVSGLLWSKQFYYYSIEVKTKEKKKRHSHSHGKILWNHLNCHDILLMPDKWEFPWFAAWDLAFHSVQMARVDPAFAKDQILLLLSDRFMHTNGQIPGCEFDFSDPNPPIICWAAWSIYNSDEKKDTTFLKTCFHRLIFSFQWWAKLDPESIFLYGNGFMGLDNISIFNRSHLPQGATELKQADCTGWMGLFSLNMLQMALELCVIDASYTDMAIKFLKHFLNIARAINRPIQHGGLWSDEDKFFYDVVNFGPHHSAIRIRSWTGIIPLLACATIQLKYSPLVKTFLMKCDRGFSPYVCKLGEDGYFLTLVSYTKLKSMLRIIFSEAEFLSPFGIRSLSKFYQDQPYTYDVNGVTVTMTYLPGESDSDLFGGNSNWRGPIWLCMNYMFVECLEKYSALNAVFSVPLSVQYPSGKGQKSTFLNISQDISRRILSIFLPNVWGARPVHGHHHKYHNDELWKALVLFYEYYHAETGRGCGASHQTGWSALALEFVYKSYQQVLKRPHVKVQHQVP